MLCHAESPCRNHAKKKTPPRMLYCTHYTRITNKTLSKNPTLLPPLAAPSDPRKPLLSNAQPCIHNPWITPQTPQSCRHPDATPPPSPKTFLIRGYRGSETALSRPSTASPDLLTSLAGTCESVSLQCLPPRFKILMEVARSSPVYRGVSVLHRLSTCNHLPRIKLQKRIKKSLHSFAVF